LTAPNQVERQLEPRDLQKCEVVDGIGVAAIKLVADDLLRTCFTPYARTE
jgi:hypothetical protein